MLFNTNVFILLFLPITILIYFLLSTKKYSLGKYILIACSIFFYAWWDIRYLPLFIGSILFNYLIGYFIASSQPGKGKKAFLILGISTNLLVLFFYKYLGFLFSNINSIFPANLPSINFILPLAISFFTFQQIEYLIDTFKGEVKKGKFQSYLLFVTFFPHIIAGPITNHKSMMSQFDDESKRLINYENIFRGIFIFALGLAKKVILADPLGHFANNGFNNMSEYGLIESWMISLSYTLQLYFDFSGYSDMAIGAALLFNIKLPINFDSPYKSLNIAEFWRKWHITLGRLLRLYIYFPLGGSRVSLPRNCFNLMITFLVCGIWHGAGWTFIIWGLYHGVGSAIHRIWASSKFQMPKLAAWFLTFNFVNIGWVIFRAPNLHDALILIKGMFGAYGIDLEYARQTVLLGTDSQDSLIASILNIVLQWFSNDAVYFGIILISLAIVFKQRNSNHLLSNLTYKINSRSVMLTALLFVLSILFINVSTEETHFLYFNF
ncbi:MBOAT family O-acyltransferase [Paenibacillus chitinolyticus]|uniref:MBOAT family O-acyltransferase n=1 Tax=Paenibacillus chitinolyticus TaxID=79263 RepID=UPI0036D7ECED